MLMIFRMIIIVLLCVMICIFGFFFCLLRPRNPNNAKICGRMFGHLAILFGIKVIVKYAKGVNNVGTCLYIANHQNNYDMVTVTNAVLDRTVTVGKKSLLWVPFFGPLYWLSGNILIDRDNRAKARSTIAKVAEYIRHNNVSVWMFPEGTRSRGRGLLPFKTGAFHAALDAHVPIVPICVSTTHNQINLNRWDNGYVIVEVLSPIDTNVYHKEQVRELSQYCRILMLKKIEQLDEEVARLVGNKKKK